jgi:hypothetical protein
MEHELRKAGTRVTQGYTRKAADLTNTAIDFDQASCAARRRSQIDRKSS